MTSSSRLQRMPRAANIVPRCPCAMYKAPTRVSFGEFSFAGPGRHLRNQRLCNRGVMTVRCHSFFLNHERRVTVTNALMISRLICCDLWTRLHAVTVSAFHRSSLRTTTLMATVHVSKQLNWMGIRHRQEQRSPSPEWWLCSPVSHLAQTHSQDHGFVVWDLSLHFKSLSRSRSFTSLSGWTASRYCSNLGA